MHHLKCNIEIITKIHNLDFCKYLIRKLMSIVQISGKASRKVRKHKNQLFSIVLCCFTVTQHYNVVYTC